MREDLKIPQNADKWWDEYERLRFNEERRLAFLNATLDSEAPENFWDKIGGSDVVVDAFNHLALTRGAREAAEFLERFKMKKRNLYEKDFHRYDYSLIDCYASLNEHEKVSDLVTNFVNDPERNVDVLFHVLDTLRLYGYAEETKRLSIAAYHKLKDSTEILPWSLIELEELAISSLLRKHAIAENTKTDEIVKELKNNGLHPKKESIDAMLKIFNGYTREWTNRDFRKSNKNFDLNLFLLSTEFMYHLRTKHSIEFITSDMFAWLLREFYDSLSRERKGRFVFTFSREYLSGYLMGYFSILSMSQARGVTLPAALKYFSNFLHERGLIIPTELEEIEGNTEALKDHLRKVCAKAPWRYKFLLQWKFDGKRLYDEDYFNVDFPVKAKKMGKNDPCPCGSGKKYKKCCGRWKK